MKPDLISVVETCYDLSLDWAALTRELAQVGQAILPIDTLPAAYTVKKVDERILVGELVADHPAIHKAFQQTWQVKELQNGELEVQSPLSRKLFEHGAYWERGVLASESYRGVPLRAVTLHMSHVKDVLLLFSNTSLSETWSVVLVGGRSQVRALAPAEKTRWLRVRAHLETAVRLRNQLAEEAAVNASLPAAIIDPARGVIHAEEEAQAPDARDALRSAARSIDQARTARTGRQDEALEIWKAMIRGEWSLVERFESDGRRFYVAHRNGQDIRDPRGLSAQEARVAAFAARGFSGKLSAYYLGVSEQTIATHLKNACRKLACASKAELVRELGPNFPRFERKSVLEWLAFKKLGEVE